MIAVDVIVAVFIAAFGFLRAGWRDAARLSNRVSVERQLARRVYGLDTRKM